jgi:hypothetical protein
MDKKLKNSESKACKAKRLKPKLMSIVTHFFETVWATGINVAAAMAISTSTH